jgi:DNA-binding NtrC family response regulator
LVRKVSGVARVVVVEDEPNIAAIIAFKLGREGHSLTMLECAGALTGALAAAKPELVVLDSSLPDAEALDLVPELSRTCPVLVLTEYRDAETPRRAAAAGAAAILSKPFKPTQLARAVSRLCKQEVLHA